MSADLVDVVLRNLMALSRIHRVGDMERHEMPNPDGSVVHFVRLQSADACFGLVHAGTGEAPTLGVLIRTFGTDAFAGELPSDDRIVHDVTVKAARWFAEVAGLAEGRVTEELAARVLNALRTESLFEQASS